MSLKYWNSVYTGLAATAGLDDDRDWLGPYLSSSKTPDDVSLATALDLGCGVGFDSELLQQRGYRVISGDFSAQALCAGCQAGRISAPLQMDIQQLGRLFPTHCFDLILANLSLHYFEADDLNKILQDVFTLLKPGGLFLGRFNSQADCNYGADQADEHGYYRDVFEGEARLKVFFQADTLHKIFKPFGDVTVHESTTRRYGQAKQLLTVSVVAKGR